MSDEEPLTIRVNVVNQAPVLAAIGNRNVGEGTLLTFTATATDDGVSGQPLTYSRVAAGLTPPSQPFSVLDFPNPFRQSFTLQVHGKPDFKTPYRIDDFFGKVVRRPASATNGNAGDRPDARRVHTGGPGPSLPRRYKLVKAH